MRKIARFNAKKKFCANDLIPAYESSTKRPRRILISESLLQLSVSLRISLG
jgi:hypothetical protein